MENITLQQFIFGIITTIVVALSPQLYNIYKSRLDAQEQKRKDDLEAKEKERTAQDTAEETTWKRVVSEYERALGSVHRLEKELEQLRPLALQNAILEQKMTQCREDKEDHKAHSEKLEEQLKEHNIIPIPFKRIVRETTDELKTVSRKMKAIKENHIGDLPSSDGSPTLVFPKEEGKQ